MDPDRIDDDLLSAWLDDELDPEQRLRVEQWLREHPEDAERVRLWAADRDALRARFDLVLDEPMPGRLQRLLRPRPLSERPWARAAAVLLLVGGGALLGAGVVARWPELLPPPLAQEQWVHRAVVAHAVYAPEQRHPVEVRAGEEHLARWLTRRTTLPVKLFNLQAQGFNLVGGRLLPDASGPSAQLMYEDAGGHRVTVYLRKPEGDTPASFRFEREGKLNLFYWVESGCGYALVGELPREQLLALAAEIYRQQTAPAAPGG
ncbi:anti-sigma factor family protein [Azohydromonas caseinilytica]|uniref:Anti-sigma factor n=1 Tax=Azohydromonas caseinilytica TaxID=2728836 RepID=A0A848FBJ4_9BURK|nr:anti-sigma factor [Azohydromonas caseinilytica]NML16266.1 anti-sigma factor [Azohydromonas caseinilytica]